MNYKLQLKVDYIVVAFTHIHHVYNHLVIDVNVIGSNSLIQSYEAALQIFTQTCNTNPHANISSFHFLKFSNTLDCMLIST
jgi:hypothetical protein